MRTAHVKMDMTETEEWLDHLRECGRKAETLKTHRSNVRQCIAYLMAVGKLCEADNITVTDIQYLWRVIEAKEEVRSQYIRSFAAMVEFHTGINPMRQANLLHNREHHNRIFISKPEFATLWRVANPFQRLIMAFGSFMGLRRSEICMIRDSDIDGDVVTIHGKGHTDDGMVVKIRIPEPVMQPLSDYRRWKKTLKGEVVDDFLFQNRGRDGKIRHVNVCKISDAITQLRKDTGIKVTTHSFRRFFATTLYYDMESDVQTIKTMMRHADVSTTFKCYIDAYDIKEREASDKLSGFLTGLIAG